MASPVLEFDTEVYEDLIHEVGNLFHRIYFAVERAGAGGGADAAEDVREGIAELRPSVEKLERFLRESLEYYHPGEPSFVELSAAELARSVAGLFATPGGGRDLRDEPSLSGLRVRVDVRHLHKALRIAGRQLLGAAGAADAAPGTPVEIAVRTLAAATPGSLAGEALELSVWPTGDPSPSRGRAAAKVEWAVADRHLEIQGGRLEPWGPEAERAGRPDRAPAASLAGRGCRLLLPVFRFGGEP